MLRNSEPPPPGLVPSCAEGGVLGAAGIVAAIQATETIKIILGAEGLLVNRLLLFDSLGDEVQRDEVAQGIRNANLRATTRASSS